ncbi:MAG: hypothetical protein Q8933_19905 [Bacteroidota bacterium]|nr:hypothetical protein [Bacteroidota bacterium]
MVKKACFIILFISLSIPAFAKVSNNATLSASISVNLEENSRTMFSPVHINLFGKCTESTHFGIVSKDYYMNKVSSLSGVKPVTNIFSSRSSYKFIPLPLARAGEYKFELLPLSTSSGFIIRLLK